MGAEYRALVWPASSGSVLISEDLFTAVSVARQFSQGGVVGPVPNTKPEGLWTEFSLAHPPRLVWQWLDLPGIFVPASIVL